MAHLRSPQWCNLFTHTFWTESCIIVTNSPETMVLPEGDSLTMPQDEPFHLSLLTRPIWGKDNFWYLSFLPSCPTLSTDPLFKPLSPPFSELKIERMNNGRYSLQLSTLNMWIQLEYYLVATYNALKNQHMEFMPMRTKIPPYPQSTKYNGTHDTEKNARRAAHRARRIFLAWLCLVASIIAHATRPVKSGPPSWFRTLAKADPPFPPFWLDKICRSEILTSFTPDFPRRGFAVNMCVEWGFLDMFHMFEVASIPIWFCFPHGASFQTGIARYLYPTQSVREVAKNAFFHEREAIEDTDDRHDVLESQTLVSGEENSSSTLFTPAGHHQTPCINAYTEDNSIADLTPYNNDALSTCFRRRKERNDKRNLAGFSELVLKRMRDRGRTLLPTSAVYEWERIEISPWFIRRRVEYHEQRRVWESYTSNQRVYDEFDDEWDCVADFSPTENIECTVVGCRDDTHIHDDDLEEGELTVQTTPVLPDHLRLPHSYHQLLAMEEGEWFRLSFTKAQIEDFTDVLRYRYGIKLTQDLGDVTEGQFQRSLAITEALRAMVQAEAMSEPEWQTNSAISLITEFYSAIKGQTFIPPHISDCHLPDQDFERERNTWGLTISRLTTVDRQSDADRQPILYSLQTINTRTFGWLIAVKGRTNLREVLRRKLGPGNAQIARALLERGIPFSMLWPAKGFAPPKPDIQALYRPENYIFSPADYRAYVERRLQLLRDKTVAIAALLLGGIVWRLAMESNIDLNSVISSSPEDMLPTLRQVRDGEKVFVESVLSQEQLDVICGVYKVYTGKQVPGTTSYMLSHTAGKGEQVAEVSWWPKVHTWNNSGLSCGHWTTQCEEWFRRRRDAVVAGTGIPKKPKEWQHTLKFNHLDTRKLIRAMEQPSPEVIQT